MSDDCLENHVTAYLKSIAEVAEGTKDCWVKDRCDRLAFNYINEHVGADKGLGWPQAYVRFYINYRSLLHKTR